MNKKISVGIAVSFILIAVTITFTATMIFAMNLFDSKVLSAQQRASMYDKLSEIDKVVRQNYYKEIDEVQLSDALAKGYLEGIGDPDSAYLSATDIARREQSMTGMQVTAGIKVAPEPSGYLVVERVYSNSSAKKAGLEVGDIITKVDDQDVLVIGYDAAAALLEGVEGAKVKLVYTRDGEEKTAELMRTATELPAVDQYTIDNVAYVRINAFNDLTLAQFDYALNDITRSDTVVGLVIDLRDVHGGYDLEIPARMLDLLLPTGRLIAGVYGDGTAKVLYTSDENSITLPITVLVNERTRGFAEIFAAVLADSERCMVVGKTTAGKGALQQLVKLTDGTGIDVTVAQLQTPSGAVISETGLAPDYNVDPAEGFVRLDVPDETADAQLKKAIEVVRAIE